MQLFWTGQGCVLYVFISNCSGAARQGVYAWRGGGEGLNMKGVWKTQCINMSTHHTPAAYTKLPPLSPPPYTRR